MSWSRENISDLFGDDCHRVGGSDTTELDVCACVRRSIRMERGDGGWNCKNEKRYQFVKKFKRDTEVGVE